MDEDEAQDSFEWAARVEVDGMFHSNARDAAANAWELLKGAPPVVEVWPQNRPENWMPVKIDLSVPDADEALAVLRSVASEALDGRMQVATRRLQQALEAFRRLEEAVEHHGVLPAAWRPKDEYSEAEKAEYGAAELGGRPASGQLLEFGGMLFERVPSGPASPDDPFRYLACAVSGQENRHSRIARNVGGWELWRCVHCGAFQVANA